jgi:hypothetical protein
MHAFDPSVDQLPADYIKNRHLYLCAVCEPESAAALSSSSSSSSWSSSSSSSSLGGKGSATGAHHDPSALPMSELRTLCLLYGDSSMDRAEVATLQRRSLMQMLRAIATKVGQSGSSVSQAFLPSC